MKERAIGRTTRPPSPEKSSPSEELQRRRDRELDELLDEALKDTFPASDPVSISVEPARCLPTWRLRRPMSWQAFPLRIKGVNSMPMIMTLDKTHIYFKDWAQDSLLFSAMDGPLMADARNDQMMFLVSKGYRCVAHDRRGHGRSSQPGNGNDLDTYADDLTTLTAALDLKNAVRVGHSTGGGEVARSPRSGIHQSASSSRKYCGIGGRAIGCSAMASAAFVRSPASVREQLIIP
jgi:hypothetical protein